MSRSLAARLRAAVALGLAALAYVAVPGPSRLRLVVYARVTAPQTWSIRYASRGTDAGPIRVAIEGSEEVQTLRFPLPEGATRVRLELGDGGGQIELRRLCVREQAGENCHRRADLHAGLRPLGGVESIRLAPRAVAIVSNGEAPTVEYDLAPLLPKSGLVRAAVVLLALLLPWSPVLLRSADRAATTALLPAVRWAIERRFVLALALLCVLVALKLHGSSVALWDDEMGARSASYQRAVWLGTPRPIVSDEWRTQTPLQLAQRRVSGDFFPVVNPNARLVGQNVLVHHAAPALEPTLVARPFHWGYLLLGNDRGLSFWWWCRGLLLFLVSFEVASLLVGGAGPLALLAALCVVWSPKVQWNYSLSQVDLLIAFLAAVSCGFGYARAPAFKQRSLFALGLALSVASFGLNVYPPYQIPLGFLGMALLLPLFLREPLSLLREPQDRAVAALLSLSLVAVAAAYLSESGGALRQLAGTVFPGGRREPGGDLPFFRLQQYVVGWRLPFVEPPFSNACELAGFVHLLPAVLLALPWTLRAELTCRSGVKVLLGFVLLALVWMVVPLPRWFGGFSLLDRVPPHRLLPLYELAALFLTVWTLARTSRGSKLRLGVACALATLGTLVSFASLASSPIESYLGLAATLASLGFFWAASVLLLRGRARACAALLLCYAAASGASVNPLARGTSPVYDKTVLEWARAIASREPAALWAVRGRGSLGNLLIASGIHSLNGTHTYPDVELWRRLDPQGKARSAYNRYATVDLEIVDGETRIEPGDDPGGIRLRANLRDLAALGVRYVLSVRAIELEDMRGLRELHRDSADEIYIYELSSG